MRVVYLSQCRLKEGSGEPMQMRRLARTFAACMQNKCILCGSTFMLLILSCFCVFLFVVVCFVRCCFLLLLGFFWGERGSLYGACFGYKS